MILSLVVGLAPQIGESYDWVARLCPGQTCDNPEFPLMDWDGKGCICRQHPCWDDDGLQHSCSPEEPFLAFDYMSDGKLACSCRKFPHFGSVYIGKELCPGESCESESAPILDYDDRERKCTCHSHPCTHDKGLEHTCDDPEFPILTFTRKEDETLQCGCNRKADPPGKSREL